MAAHRPRLHGRSARNWPTLGSPETIALALALFFAILVLREIDVNVADADEILFVMPIALLALRFGLRGGLTSGLLAFGLIVTWDLFDPGAVITAKGYLIRGIAFLLLGTLLGSFVDQRRRLESQLLHYYDASLDMLATANLDGWFTRVNQAWERTLGHSAETMTSQPYIEFVHPEDREATIAEAAVLAEHSHNTVSFRNRYLAADGNYRWLEWTASSSPPEGAIHAVARDITVQHEAEEQLANNAQLLEAKVAERTRELDNARAETLQRLALAAEYRDDDTSQHTERVGATAAEIAARLQLGSDQVTLVREAAPLHDVGKLAISDTILLKPGKLSADEYEVMKTHSTLGARLLSGSSSPVLQMAAVIAATHHERWDGTGYPAGLAGEAIPLVGRVVAVADVFDALGHDRPYKSAWPVERAIAEIRRGAGSQFDPRVAAAFLAIHNERAAAPEAGPQQPARTVARPRQRRSRARVV
jgi:PAS domain S-box-containing protein